MQSYSHVVDPLHTLQSERILPRRIRADSYKLSLELLLEDEGLGNLDKGRMWTVTGWGTFIDSGCSGGHTEVVGVLITVVN